MAFCTSFRVAGRTRWGSLMQRDTVAMDTPAILATSLMETWLNVLTWLGKVGLYTFSKIYVNAS